MIHSVCPVTGANSPGVLKNIIIQTEADHSDQSALFRVLEKIRSSHKTQLLKFSHNNKKFQMLLKHSSFQLFQLRKFVKYQKNNQVADDNIAFP